MPPDASTGLSKNYRRMLENLETLRSKRLNESYWPPIEPLWNDVAETIRAWQEHGGSPRTSRDKNSIFTDIHGAATKMVGLLSESSIRDVLDDIAIATNEAGAQNLEMSTSGFVRLLDKVHLLAESLDKSEIVGSTMRHVLQHGDSGLRDPDLATWWTSNLFDIVGSLGVDMATFEGVLAGRAFDIWAAQGGEGPMPKTSQTTELSQTHRVELALRSMNDSRRIVDSVAWFVVGNMPLAYERKGGSSVEFFDSRWFDPDAPSVAIPERIGAEVRHLSGLPRDETTAYVRVTLREVLAEESLGRSRRLVEQCLAVLSSAYDKHAILQSGHVLFFDGDPVGWRRVEPVGAIGHVTPYGYQRIPAALSDVEAAVSKGRGPLLDQLVVLDRARRTGDESTIGDSYRVLDAIRPNKSNGILKAMSKSLALSSHTDLLMSAISRCIAMGSLLSRERADQIRATVAPSNNDSFTFYPDRAVDALEGLSLIDHGVVTVDDVLSLVTSPQLARAFMDAQKRLLDDWLSRSRRIRNTLEHGGPVESHFLRRAADFMYRVSAGALWRCLESEPEMAWTEEITNRWAHVSRCLGRGQALKGIWQDDLSGRV